MNKSSLNNNKTIMYVYIKIFRNGNCIGFLRICISNSGGGGGGE